MTNYHKLSSHTSPKYYTCRDIIGKKFRAVKDISLISLRDRNIVRKNKIVIIKGIQVSRPKKWEKYLCCRQPQVKKVTVLITSNANSQSNKSGIRTQTDDKIIFYLPKESDPLFTFVTRGSETKIMVNTQYLI